MVGHRGLQVGDIGGGCFSPCVPDRAGHGELAFGRRFRARRGRRPLLARGKCPSLAGVEPPALGGGIARLGSAQATVHVGDKARLPKLPVADDADPRFHLPAYDVRYVPGLQLFESLSVVGLTRGRGADRATPEDAEGCRRGSRLCLMIAPRARRQCPTASLRGRDGPGHPY